MTESQTFAYLRVSTVAQNFDRQEPAFTELGIPMENFYRDKISGVKASRPALDALIGAPDAHGVRKGGVARKGDVIYVHSIDRLGRSTIQILETLEALVNKGVTVKSLKQGEDFESVNGKLMIQIFAALAEWERSNTRERVEEARAARKTQGKSTGRKRALDAKGVAKVLKKKSEGQTPDQIAKSEGVSRATVYRVLSENKG